MRFLYSRLPVHKPNTERVEEDEDGPEQSLEPPRAFCKWLPMFLILFRVIRETFWETVERKPYTHSHGPHIDYCFDTLRQYIQCNADSTPLYTLGDFTAGNDQLHRCKDWSQLRDYATRHTACIRDGPEDVSMSERFGLCDTGEDSIVDLAE